MKEEIKTFLDEGYDFIEESYSGQPLEYTEVNNDIIVESENGDKNSYHILGICRGVFQPINEPSRNNRIYESNHWQLQLNKPEVQERVKTRSMWGTLGHFDRKITDCDIREGLVSHIISKLEIREDINNKPFLYGELEILDTPSGRILEAMYKGGANLFVSSRGAGKLISVIGDNMKHVDPNSFWFEGFDIVRAPGFLQAKPVFEGVKESKDEKVTEELEISISENNRISEKEEITSLKEQVEKLSYIVEKVVNSIQKKEDIKEGNNELTEQQKGALLGLVGYLTESKLSEKDMLEVLEKVKEGLKHE